MRVSLGTRKLGGHPYKLATNIAWYSRDGYCRHWYRVTSQRIDSNWWDTVLAPLKELESSENSSQGCSDHLNSKNTVDSKQIGVSNSNNIPLKNQSLFSRSSLEDMDLETRSLTEPIPTNQLAFKNHNLYAIEKWLIKYQVLHPKGPIVGWCSGHPVFPRSCVQTVQTRQKWLRDGLQVRENEIPAKVSFMGFWKLINTWRLLIAPVHFAGFRRKELGNTHVLSMGMSFLHARQCTRARPFVGAVYVHGRACAFICSTFLHARPVRLYVHGHACVFS
ncbi:hypothetical protein KSP40_PGU003222 [Platanthera guangdongensis]|uniref:Rad4 beta-hairpin domain-containing protein n=1 Tax=Platanthera guangdongensis TaxID=2320717 RepID=A0ABR2LKW0_9ASPA